MTALLPLILFPLLGIAGVEGVARPYGDPVIFLFLGGLLLGLAMQKWELHRRIALRIVSWVGTRPANLVLGFMAATAFISMWVSNTATAAMMLPVSLSLAVLLVGDPAPGQAASRGRTDFALALMLGVAFAASIGGMATLVGTPPNALLAGFMAQHYHVEIGFAQWMAVGVPVASLLLLGAWVILTRIVFRVPSEPPPGLPERLAAEMATLAPMTRPEKLVGLIFLAAAAAWLFRPMLADYVPGLSDATVAVAAALLLFLVPSGRGGFLMDWATASRLPWEVLVLFGGGLSLAAGITATGLSSWLGEALMALDTLPKVVLILGMIVAAIAFTEVASNTATAAAFLPVVASVSDGLELNPFMLTVPVVLAASCGFMLPVSTPPNALFYASGYFTVAQMARAGFLIDVLGAALILGASYSLVGVFF
jgi:sodium-dependent dicarboxylate transporter 2/3/5